MNDPILDEVRAIREAHAGVFNFDFDASDADIKPRDLEPTMNPDRSLNIDQATLASICQTHQIRRLSLFGSQLKGTAGPDSDVDLLVEFDPGAHPTLLDLAQIEIELSRALGGKKVDVRTPEDLSRFFRNDVLSMAEVQYVAG